MTHQFDFMPDELDATKDVLETALRHERERLKEESLRKKAPPDDLVRVERKIRDLEAALAKLNKANYVATVAKLEGQ
jgi:hypothetical protein